MKPLKRQTHQIAHESIAEVARNVATVFARGRAKQLPPSLRADLENELARFKIWAGTLGVFAPGPASVDYRLRDDAEVRDIVLQMLDRLRQGIKQAMDPPTILEEPDGSESDDRSSISSEDSMAVSLDQDSDLDAELEDKSTHAALESLRHREDISTKAVATVQEMITKLYRLSAIIKKPSSSNENVKVANFIAKGEDFAELHEFKTSVRWQIQFRLPDATASLLDRLVNAAVFRKKKLQYRQRHNAKLSQGVERSLDVDLTVPVIANNSAMKLTGPSKAIIPKVTQRTGSARGSLNTFQYSATEASSVNRLKFASYPKSVALSGITRSAVGRRDGLDIPGPPSKTTEDSQETLCPYCNRVIDKEEMVHARWKRHILRDIEPYVCLFEGCNKPNECFATIDEWIQHMEWQHALVWCCQAPGHETTICHSEEEFRQHLCRTHDRDFNESQLPMIIKKSAQPVSDIFATFALANQNGKDKHSENAGTCPLCPYSVEAADFESERGIGKLEVPSTTMQASKRLRNHIAAHMEAISLLSLPERDDLDDADSNERESEYTEFKNEEQDVVETLPSLDDFSTEEYLLENLSLDDNASRNEWNHILDDPRVKRLDTIDLAKDPKLQEFVRRARQLELLRIWRISKIPVIVVHDPDGLEVDLEETDRLDPAMEGGFDSVDASGQGVEKRGDPEIPTIVLHASEEDPNMK